MSAHLETELVVRDLVETDIAQLPALFEACYGASYSDPMFYDASELREAVASGRLRPVVAVWRGRVAGHMALTVRHGGARVCEAGNTVVHPGARGHGLMPRLALALHERTRREGFSGYMHYPTTAHAIMQRASVLNGGVETGVMLSYVPADTEYAQFAQAGTRLAVTVAFQPVGELPARELARLPRRYESLLRERYERCGLTRMIVQDSGSEKWPEHSRVRTVFSPRRAALHLNIEAVGEDFEATIARALQQSDPAAAYADLPVDLPGIDAAIEALRAERFFFSALLPEFGSSDVLRMQRLRDGSSELLNPMLANADAQKLLTTIREDFQS